MSGGRAQGSTDIERWDQALAWYINVRDGGNFDFTGPEWQEWCADPENRRIFDNVSRLLSDRRTYGPLRQPPITELTDDQYDASIPIRQWLTAQAARKARKLPSFVSGWWLLCGGIAIAATLLLFVLYPLWSWRSVSAGEPIYQTRLGELKEVRLSDGSRVVLGGQTMLSVVFCARQRSVKLISGEAWFRVAHNSGWPFIVAAGDGTITAVGTAFVVTRDSNRVVVAVTDGTVEVRTRRVSSPSGRLVEGAGERPSFRPIRVARGQAVAFGDNGSVGSLEPTDTHAATGWTQGRLTFDDQPLRYVIESVNRYSSRHIVVDNRAGALRFSGIVLDHQIDDWLQSLEGIFPVHVEQEKADVQIRMRRPLPAALDPRPKSRP